MVKEKLQILMLAYSKESKILFEYDADKHYKYSF